MCLAANNVEDKQITEGQMAHKAQQKEELERIDTMTILEAVAYANRLSRRLVSDDWSGEERQHGLELLRRLTERVQFLKITLDPVYSEAASAH